MLNSKRWWLAVLAIASLVQIALCLKFARVELTAGLGICWFVFFLLAADLHALRTPRIQPARLSAAIRVLLAAALSGLALLMLAVAGLALSHSANPDSSLHGAEGTLLRLFPLTIAASMLLFRGVREDLRAQLFASSALLCPLISPVPDWIRSRIEVSPLSALGAAKLLGPLGLAVGRRGPLLDLPSGDHLLVNTQCSGLGSMVQLIAIAYLLWLVLDAKTIRLIALFPICLALGFAVNCARVAWLAVLLDHHEKMRFDFWHEQSGSLIYQAIATTLLLLIAFPLLTRKSPAPQMRSS